jgi:hypothetical protein
MRISLFISIDVWSRLLGEFDLRGLLFRHPGFVVSGEGIGPPAPPHDAHDHDDQEDDQKHVKQDLRNPGRRACCAAEAEKAATMAMTSATGA